MLETCSDLMRKAYERNWITARDGNISVRWSDRDHFWVTPSGIRKTELSPSLFKKISVETGEELQYTDVSHGLRASGELPMHYQLQKNMPSNVSERVVVHLHPTYTVAAMHRGLHLNLLVKSFPELGRYTKVGPNVGDIPPITKELADACVKNIGLNDDGSIEYDIVGMKGHGVVAVDVTPWRAFEHIERLEHICKIILVSGKVSQQLG